MSLVLSFRKRRRSQSRLNDNASSIARSSPSVLPEHGLPICKSPPHTSLPTPDQSLPPHAIDVTKTSTPPPSLAIINLTAIPTSPQCLARPRLGVILLVTAIPLSDLNKRSLDCSICYDDYDEYVYTEEFMLRHTDHPIRLDYTITRGIRSQLCGHILGRRCLEEYLEASLSSNTRNYKCPMCSTPLCFSSSLRPFRWPIIPCDLWIPRTQLSAHDFESQSPPCRTQLRSCT